MLGSQYSAFPGRIAAQAGKAAANFMLTARDALTPVEIGRMILSNDLGQTLFTIGTPEEKGS